MSVVSQYVYMCGQYHAPYSVYEVGVQVSVRGYDFAGPNVDVKVEWKKVVWMIEARHELNHRRHLVRQQVSAIEVARFVVVVHLDNENVPVSHPPVRHVSAPW